MSTDNIMFVKPVDKALVRDPQRDNQHLPEGGAFVPRNAYWLRRLNDASVVEAKAPKTAKPVSKRSEDK